MLWLLVDLGLVALALVVLALTCLSLWRRLKALKGDVDGLGELAAQASDAVASIQR